MHVSGRAHQVGVSSLCSASGGRTHDSWDQVIAVLSPAQREAMLDGSRAGGGWRSAAIGRWVGRETSGGAALKVNFISLFIIIHNGTHAVKTYHYN